MSFRLLIACGFLLAACGSSYVYQPETQANATMRGNVAADYPLPSAVQQHGDARIASFGVSKIKRTGLPPIRALQARMVVSNNSNTDWHLDTRQQEVALHDGRHLQPGYVYSDAGDTPLVTIPPNGKRTINLFYPLPVDVDKARHVPQFDLLWRVDTGGGQVVAMRTPFQRLAIEPAYAGPGWWGGWWGPYAWYDPFWGAGIPGAAGWYW
jgi:hypothetical protein